MRRALLAFLCAWLLTVFAFADFKYSVTSTMGGVFATNVGAQMVAGGDVTVYVRGRQMRIDRLGKIRIIDLNAEQVTEIDPKAKTYWIASFGQLRQQLQKMMDEAQQRFGQLPDSLKAQAGGTSAAGAFGADFEPKPTGATQVIGKWMATEYAVTHKMPSFAGIAAGQASGAPATPGQGEMTMYIDEWMTNQIDASEFQGLVESIAKDPLTAGVLLGGISSSFGFDKAFGSKAVPGFPVKTVVRMLASQPTVPPPVNADQTAPAPSSPQTVELMRMERTLSEVSNAPLDPMLFAIPGKYNKVAPPEHAMMF